LYHFKNLGNGYSDIFLSEIKFIWTYLFVFSTLSAASFPVKTDIGTPAGL
jgi:hypothetical protein